MRTDELDFELPPHLIAQVPPTDRTSARLLHYRREDRSINHRVFSDLPKLLRPGDLLVFNDARVVPARFTLKKQTGGRVEALYLGQPAPGQWHVLLKNAGNISGSMEFADDPSITASVMSSLGNGEFHLRIASDRPALEVLGKVGRMPLPPYIRREKDHDHRDDLDRQRYQTVFAKNAGAVAAPTAALHFSDALLAALTQRGVDRTFVTLHVGLGTFKPVMADSLEAHAMHSERYSIEPVAAEAINRAKQENRRVIAVGTTSARVLESQPPGWVEACSDQTEIFIYPPYRWKHVDALITNFHLPRSTLIALVAALVGLDDQRRIYAAAIEQQYRFFSYGDAMLIE